MTIPEIRCLLVSDFTISGLVPMLAAAGDAPALKGIVAPFDQVTQVLLSDQIECWESKPDIALVWTRPESAIKSFGRLLNGERVSTDDILAEVDQFAERLRFASTRVAQMFVPTWTWPSHDRLLGVLNLDVKGGPVYHLLRMNARLAEALDTQSNIHVLDAGRWVASAGAVATSPKLWYLGKIAFSPEVFSLAAADIKAAVRAAKGLSRKLVVLDLDDTLWGGIVGEVGWERLVLGGHNPVGESFCAFQRALAALTRRGVVLGIVSKNTEPIALQAIDSHPEMVLRRNDFAGWRINWNDKAQNLAELAAELDLGLDAVVFIDDSAHERARVRAALPQVLVPDWPADKLLYCKALAELTCFDTVGISEEDHSRTRMYVSERDRRTLKASAQSMDEYLASLELQVKVEQLNAANLMRAAQLLNKTNQMNLRTRRLTEDQLRQWADTPGNLVYVFRVADRFDDYGLTGIASLTVKDGRADVVDFLLSCRVIGRGVEEALLHTLAGAGRALGGRTLSAVHLPTARNSPCGRFFEEHSGLRQTQDGHFEWDLLNPYPAPRHVTVHEEVTEPVVEKRA